VPDNLEEAKCLLGVAHATRDVCRAIKRLADYRVKETLLRAELYQLHATKAEQQLRVAEMDVGRARLVVRKGGFFRSSMSGPSSRRVKHNRGEPGLNIKSLINVSSQAIVNPNLLYVG
jgi:hypothetical protein